MLLPFEFKITDFQWDAHQTIVKHLGPDNTYYGDKKIYRNTNPDHLVVFNASIVIKNVGKIWSGDIDLTLFEENLLRASYAIRQKLYVIPQQNCYGEEWQYNKAVYIAGKIPKFRKDWAIRSNSGKLAVLEINF